MSHRNRIPPALSLSLALPPEASLILLTGTLGCSTTWLTSRFVSTVLAPSETAAENAGNAVVLVSWLRDEKFWRDEVRRATGHDIAKLSSSGHFAFVDGLTALATSKSPDAGLSTVERAITTALEIISEDGKHLTLVLDQPDTLLATAVTASQALNHLILTLRSKVHATILTLSADLPLVSAATPALSHSTAWQQSNPTPLENETAAFLVQQAHAARFVMSVRELDTGAARDVSGVLSVTRGGDAEGFGLDDEDGEEEIREMEALFLVGRDGGVKVFERGSAG